MGGGVGNAIRGGKQSQKGKQDVNKRNETVMRRMHEGTIGRLLGENSAELVFLGAELIHLENLLRERWDKWLSIKIMLATIDRLEE